MERRHSFAFESKTGVRRIERSVVLPTLIGGDRGRRTYEGKSVHVRGNSHIRYPTKSALVGQMCAFNPKTPRPEASYRLLEGCGFGMIGCSILFAIASYSAAIWRNAATSFLSVRIEARRRHFAASSRRCATS